MPGTDEVTKPFFQVAGVVLTLDSSTLREQITLVRVPVLAYIFFLFGYFLNSQTLKLCSNTSIIKLYILKVICAPLAGLEI
jgi:hypothetical protein